MNEQIEEQELEDYHTIEVEDEQEEKLDYPDLKIKIDKDQYSIYEMKRKYDRGKICMDPSFQRNFVWKNKQMSELIESVIIGIPLPLIYLAESQRGDLVVVDGRQRLTTFIKFLNDEFRLNGLRILKDINGCCFSDLEKEKRYSKYATSIEDFQLVVQVIKYPTPDKVRFDIFDRVNRGGTPLNKQEMRNALYQGQSTQMLKELSEGEAFLAATGGSISPKHMKDRYIILRALCFDLYQKRKLTDADGKIVEYRSDIEDFLGTGMEFLNRMPSEELRGLKEEFERTMWHIYHIIGDNAFRIPTEYERRRPISMTLFEALYYLFQPFVQIKEEDITKLQESVKELLKDPVFLESLQFSVDSKNHVDIRFHKVMEKYQEKFNDK
ncbi:DUF262 domain-containing protein [Roseburia rectibacter]|uniref:DUF262 domain-containing protein n=1 Tax=Roseburia rectibacter TaxID=2763062 RepID=UPI00164A4145|nr:DUF262 domain-containing protein [Roseburia rectibacter]UMY99729.1 DUF262 domain-containing protein [Roseburia rectibacter]